MERSAKALLSSCGKNIMNITNTQAYEDNAPLIYTILQHRLAAGEVIRVDLESHSGLRHAGLRKIGVLKSIAYSSNPYLEPELSYTFYYESLEGVEDSALFFQQDLEERSYLQKVETGWLLKINVARN